jgi:dTMP kinase
MSSIEQSLAQERQGDDRHYLNGKQDIHESSMALQKNVRQEYLKLVEEQEDFHLINCADGNGYFLQAEAIHAKVAKHLAGLFKTKGN